MPEAPARERRTRNSVTFQGNPLNLSKMSRDTHMSRTLLSRIFSGELTGSVDSLLRISAQLDMSVQDLIEGLQEVKDARQRKVYPKFRP